MNLTGYIIDSKGMLHQPRVGAMFDYILSGDGLYLSAQREEMAVCFQIAAAEVRGLPERVEFLEFRLPKVPESVVAKVLSVSHWFAQDSLETLFWLQHSALNPYYNGWLVREPLQVRTLSRCRPEDGQDEICGRAIIEIHSHHSMAARFSPTDDADETGFRLYGVIGRLPGRPEIRFRVGVYGYHWEIPASWVMELPAGLRDCVGNEDER